MAIIYMKSHLRRQNKIFLSTKYFQSYNYIIMQRILSLSTVTLAKTILIKIPAK